MREICLHFPYILVQKPYILLQHKGCWLYYIYSHIQFQIKEVICGRGGGGGLKLVFKKEILSI